MSSPEVPKSKVSDAFVQLHNMILSTSRKITDHSQRDLLAFLCNTYTLNMETLTDKEIHLGFSPYRRGPLNFSKVVQIQTSASFLHIMIIWYFELHLALVSCQNCNLCKNCLTLRVCSFQTTNQNWLPVVPKIILVESRYISTCSGLYGF